MEWKKINKYPKYEISNSGLVRNIKTKNIKKPYYHLGYAKIQLYNEAGRKSFRVHRLVAESYMDNYNESLVVDHINKVRDDNRLENLRIVTQRENLFNRSMGVDIVDDIIEWHKIGATIEEIKRRLTVF